MHFLPENCCSPDHKFIVKYQLKKNFKYYRQRGINRDIAITDKSGKSI